MNLTKNSLEKIKELFEELDDKQFLDYYTEKNVGLSIFEVNELFGSNILEERYD